jgi:endoglucanase
MEKKDIVNIKSIQRELSELIGVSGNEKPIARFIQSQIDGLVGKMWVDPLGSLLAIIEGEESKEKIMLDAHMDEIGFMISHIDPKGFLRFVPIGGWDNRISWDHWLETTPLNNGK